MLVLEDNNVQSSAYVISLMPSGGSGNRDMYRLNNVRGNTPCGTSLFHPSAFGVNVSECHLFIVGGNVVSRMIFMRIPILTISKARERSRA